MIKPAWLKISAFFDCEQSIGDSFMNRLELQIVMKISELFIEVIFPIDRDPYPEGSPAIPRHSDGLIILHFELNSRWAESGMQLYIDPVDILR